MAAPPFSLERLSHASDGRMGRVLHLAPGLRQSAPVRVVCMFRYNALEAEPTGMLENHPAIAGKMLHIGEPVTLGGEQLFKPSLALQQRPVSKIFAVELNKVEGEQASL